MRALGPVNKLMSKDVLTDGETGMHYSIDEKSAVAEILLSE
jgi:hypothetical protein